MYNIYYFLFIFLAFLVFNHTEANVHLAQNIVNFFFAVYIQMNGRMLERGALQNWGAAIARFLQESGSNYSAESLYQSLYFPLFEMLMQHKDKMSRNSLYTPPLKATSIRTPRQYMEFDALESF